MKAFAVLVTVAAALSCLHTRAASPGKNTLEVAFMPSVTFPHELSQRGIREGEADVMVSIGTDGRTADWLVTACTDPSFEKMLAELLPVLEFKLSTAKELTGPVRVSLRFLFESTGVVVSHTASESVDNLLNRMTTPRRIDKLGTPRQLDRTLTLKHTVSPLYPEDLNTAGTRVTMEFLVDQNGRVRMPVLHDGENLLLANAAANALLDWRFDPPTRGGKPVIVTARQEFVLSPR